MIILVMTGGIVMSSKDSERTYEPGSGYPYSIAITFDDGPHFQFTERINRILVENNIRATFFLVGDQMLKYPKIIKSLKDSGQELEGHTMSHPSLIGIPEEKVYQELSSIRVLINKMTGQKSNFFRPPGGQYNRRILKAAGKLGLSIALWTVFPNDHIVEDPDILVKRIIAQAEDGGVILLHSGRLGTVEALPRIITELRLRGYNFVTIEELSKTALKKQKVWLKAPRKG